MAGQPGVIRVFAQLTTPAAQVWLATSQQARVLHLFDRVCNLVNEQGEVLSLVAPEIGAGPFHVVLENPFVVGDLSPSDGDKSLTTNKVIVYSQGMQVGWLLVDVSQAAIWEPCVDWDGMRAATAVWQPHIPLMCTMVAQYRKQMGLDTAVTPQLEAGLNLLLRGIATQEISLVQAGATRLAGLGPGLTPAGDDILMGAIYALWAIYPPEVVRPMVAAVVDTAVPYTTTLSAAWLRAAGGGEAGAVWHELGNQLSVNGNQWAAAVARILAVGHSSGADALWGFTAVVGNGCTQEFNAKNTK